MLRLLTDENFKNDIVRGLKLRLPRLDVVSVRHVGLAGLPESNIAQVGCSRRKGYPYA